ncbi:hypothetical protein QBC36DRAFT_131639 [Triangularia setosa]|uniref:Uncharacterized protein n=1 Tax=Triangularia setosa TaxID=2587417 RepID=A0AAN6W8J5_9PEZI|nr:hypothetical protein QBC36DRAFT_131639 [Podospora setosa]
MMSSVKVGVMAPSLACLYLPCLAYLFCAASLVGRNVESLRQSGRCYWTSSCPNPLAAAWPATCLLSRVFPWKDTVMVVVVGSGPVERAEAPGWDLLP